MPIHNRKTKIMIISSFLHPSDSPRATARSTVANIIIPVATKDISQGLPPVILKENINMEMHNATHIQTNDIHSISS